MIEMGEKIEGIIKDTSTLTSVICEILVSKGIVTPEELLESLKVEYPEWLPKNPLDLYGYRLFLEDSNKLMKTNESNPHAGCYCQHCNPSEQIPTAPINNV